MAGVISALVAATSVDHHRVSTSLHAGWYGTAIAAVVLVSGRALLRGFREPHVTPAGAERVDHEHRS
jgi:hypothetical protein